MIRISLYITALLAGLSLNAQNIPAASDWTKKIHDPWFHQYGNKGLQVGDTMPDIPLGKVTNNYTGKTRFGALRGKLVILDFWGTGCSSCIKLFPHLEKLQQKYNDKIQIILVNYSETQETIDKFVKKSGIRMPDLPSIVMERDYGYEETDKVRTRSSLLQLLPLRVVPMEVWIGADGKIVQNRGALEAMTEENIENYLNGRPINFVNGQNKLPYLDYFKDSYYKVIGDLSASPGYASFITPFNNELNGVREVSGYFITDSLTNTVRMTWMNYPLLDIYLNYSRGKGYFITEEDHSIVWSPDRYGGRIVFPASVDTLLYTNQYYFSMENYTIPYDQLTRSKYCFEQILPLDVPETTRYAWGFEDLNRYFASKYKLVASVEKRTIPCYILVRTSGQDKLSVGSTSAGRRQLLQKKGQSLISYVQWEFSGILEDVSQQNSRFQAFMDSNKKNGRPFLIRNETGWPWNKTFNIILPAEIDDIVSLKAALKAYDLDIVEAERESSFLVFKSASEL